MKELKKNKIVLGLSGGVDSTTAALLLKKKGFEVIGFYFDVLENNINGKNEAEQVAKQLGIKFVSKDVSKAFEEIVIGNFCDEYINGRTPNPCVICNPNIKFKELIDIANSEDAYYIATGHYANIFYDELEELYYIQKGTNEKKDQSYMLYRLGQEVLSRLMLPLGNIINKENTRNIARENNLLNADKKDSQEICFIDNEKDDYVSYILNKGLSSKKGNFIDKNGKILGQHKGLINYTVGQRKGLGIALGKQAFVTKINSKTNEIVLGDNEELLTDKVISRNNFFTKNSCDDFPVEYEGKKIKAKIRYAAKPSWAKIFRGKDGTVVTEFEDKQRAATGGQSIVFYDGDCVIGGGFIVNE